MKHLVFAWIALVIAMPVLATDPAGSPDKAASSNPANEKNSSGDNQKKPEKKEFDLNKLPGHIREKLEKMAPQEREKFLQNMRRWEQMGKDDRDRIKEVGRQEFKRMREEMDKLANAFGLAPDSDARKQFESRYREERRKVEQKVVEQLKSIRKPLMDEMHDHLRKEFSPAAVAPATSPAPGEAPTPSPAP